MKFNENYDSFLSATLSLEELEKYHNEGINTLGYNLEPITDVDELDPDDYLPAGAPPLHSHGSSPVSSIDDGAGGQWPFTKIEPALPPAPEFNTAMLPSAFAAFVEDAAYRMQCPPDYIAVALMVSLSAVVGRKFAIHPKQKDSWLVVPNLWGCIVGNPSAKKSPAMAEGIKAVVELEGAAKQQYKEANKAYAIDAELHKLEEKEAGKEAKQALADSGRDSARKLLEEAQRLAPEQPVRKRYKTNSATVEKLGELLADNPNGILIIRDELSGFLGELDKQGHEADRGFYLEAWAGNSSFAYDRIGRGTVDIASACVSILGGTQPDKLQPLVKQAVMGGTGNDGFIQRFQLLVYPDRKPETYVDDLPGKMAESRMLDVFKLMAAIEAGEQIKLRFSPEAQALFIEWHEELTTKLSDPDIHPAIESHLSKYKSMVPSLALLIHLADNPASAAIGAVTQQAMIKALVWAEYLEGHMHRVYSLSESMEQDNAITIARKFGKQLQGSFTARDVALAGWKGIGKSTERVQTAISILLDCGYVREQYRDTNGRPTVDYVINEAVIGCHG